MWQKGGDVLSEDRTKFTMNQEPSLSQVMEIQDWHQEGGIHLPATASEAGGFSTGDCSQPGALACSRSFPSFPM